MYTHILFCLLLLNFLTDFLPWSRPAKTSENENKRKGPETMRLHVNDDKTHLTSYAPHVV